jgi:hypothetical protein
MTATISQVANELCVSPQYAGALVSDAENRAMWARLREEIEDIIEVAEEDGD